MAMLHQFPRHSPSRCPKTGDFGLGQSRLATFVGSPLRAVAESEPVRGDDLISFLVQLGSVALFFFLGERLHSPIFLVKACEGLNDGTN